jgi:membrane protein
MTRGEEGASRLRGADARTGLVDFGRAVIQHVGRDDIGAYAAALTYNLLFAVFPLGLALAGLLTWLHLPAVELSLLRLLSAVLAPEVLQLIAQTIFGRAGAANPALVYGGMVGYLIGMSGAFRSMMDALNHAFEYPRELRPIWKTYGISLLLVLGQTVALVVAGLVEVALERGVTVAASHLLGAAAAPVAAWCLRLLLLPAIALPALGLLYWLLPDRPRPFALVSPGAIVAVLAWMATSGGFSIYLAHFNSYNRIYGSFGAAILLLLYLYFLSYALLIGAEVNAEIERRRA